MQSTKMTETKVRQNNKSIMTTNKMKHESWQYFRVDDKKPLKSVVHTYRKRQKEAKFNKPFSIRWVVAEYDVHYKTLRDPFCGAREVHKAYVGAQMLTAKQEKVIAFHLNQTESNLIKMQVILRFCL